MKRYNLLTVRMLIKRRFLDSLTDANGNRTALAFDTLGLVHKTAVMGKVGNNEGDTLEFPTTELEYDLFQYLNHEQPNYAYTKAREIHGDPNTRWLESYTYTDGLGRVLLEKAKVAPGKAFIFIDGELQYDEGKPLIAESNPRWLGSGRIVYNNKGEPVKQYEPYFSNTHEYEKESEAREFGVSLLLHYDALGRNIRIDHPDGSFEQVVFDCWQQKNYDRNDTVKDSEWYAERGSPQPSDPEPTDPRERAAWLAIKHYDTPETLDLDVLGVIYRQRHDNGTYDGITTTHIYHDTIFVTDIEGKRRKVTDARELEISYQYDMRPIQEDEEGNSDGGTVIQSESPDSGLKIQLPCVDGQPLFAVDAVGNHFLYDYDALRRPLRIKTKINGAANYITTTFYEYGESLVNPEQDNLRGQLYQIYDANGLSQSNVFDFKGNLLSSQKQLLEDATLSEVDWEGNTSPDLSTEVFESSMTYDALDRVVTQTDPGSNLTEHLYDEGGALKTVKLNEANYVQDIHYNEKGQRKDIWYGNGTKTSYTYDEFTFRLRRLLTVKLNTNDILQDLNYWYDPVGNITEIQDDAQQTLFFNNSVVAPTQKFVYDAIYRLSEAKGRELIGTANFGNEDNWNDAAWQTSHKGDGSAVQNYIQKYIYDEVGNVLELQHTAGIGSYTRTYNYDVNSNKLLSTEVGSNTYSYSHDARGNMTEMPHLSEMNWNTQNELKSIMRGSEPTCYQYSNGERVRKFTDKGIIKEERIYLGNFEIYRKFEEGSLKIERQTVHINDDTGRIAMLEKRTFGSAADDNDTAESLERYVYSNHLQSASLELDEIGAIISYEEYHPYGTTSYQAMNASINATAKRYRYTGKERDEESGLYYHGARYYVPWLGRWTGVDPLGEEMPSHSPYNYAFNNPVYFIDPDGKIPYPITIRSFAADKWFGLGFHGDNRGFSNIRSYPNGNGPTARVHQVINFDTDKSKISANAWSSETYHRIAPFIKKTAIPSIKFRDGFKTRTSGDSKTFMFGTHSKGANPLIPNSPHIDVFSDFSITENKKAGTLDISGTLTGDNFPSTEVFISDPSGQNVFLDIGFYEGSPFTSLEGENQRLITDFNFSITTDKKGNFTGIIMGNETYSIKDWNKKFETADPHKNRE